MYIHVAVPQLRFLAAALPLLEDALGRSGLSGMAWAMQGLIIHVPLPTVTIRIVKVNLLEGRKQNRETLQNCCPCLGDSKGMPGLD